MTTQPRPQRNDPSSPAPFGTEVSSHMLLIRFDNGRWREPEIKPFGNLPLSPTSLCLQYGQTIFEGMKAFRRADNRVAIFRIDRHHARFCASAQRMSMPALPYDLFATGIIDLVSADQEFLREEEGAQLYIRPSMIASEQSFGVKASREYLFVVFTSAVGAYHSHPLRVKVEEHFIRAAKGGTGFAKCGGNYGGALYPAEQARREGFDDVLWTDGSEALNLEEAGAMNIFFRIGNTLVTPPLSDTILDGVTRESYIRLSIDNGWKVEERAISAFEVLAAYKDGTLREAFGAGTAAVAAPIAEISVRGEKIVLPALAADSYCMTVRDQLTQIRTGRADDRFSWNTIV